MNSQQKANFTKMKSQKNNLYESGGQDNGFDIKNAQQKKQGLKSQHNGISAHDHNNDGIYVGTKTIDSGEYINPPAAKKSNEL